MFHHRLLSPEGEASAGGESTATPAPVESAGTADVTTAQPASQPAGITITPDEQAKYERYGQQAAESQRQFQKLKETGYDKFDSALTDLQTYAKLKTEHPGILDALMQPPAEALTETPSGQPLTLEDVQKTVAQQFQAIQTEQFQKEHARNVEREDQLLGETWADPRFKNFTGDTSLQDAMEGKGSESAQAFAAIMDAAFSAVAEQYPTGQSMPVTKAEQAQQAKDWAVKAIQQIAATSILAASTDNASQITPNATPTNMTQDAPEDSWEARERAEEARRQAAQQHFDHAFKQAQGGTASSVYGVGA